MREHLDRKHNGRPNFLCELCQKGFVIKEKLVVHKGRHTRDTPCSPGDTPGLETDNVKEAKNPKPEMESSTKQVKSEGLKSNSSEKLEQSELGEKEGDENKQITDFHCEQCQTQFR